MTACAACGREIHVGDDCFQVAKGVFGTRDFINLESQLFCSEECVDHLPGKFDEDDSPGLAIPRQRRVP